MPSSTNSGDTLMWSHRLPDRPAAAAARAASRVACSSSRPRPAADARAKWRSGGTPSANRVSASCPTMRRCRMSTMGWKTGLKARAAMSCSNSARTCRTAERSPTRGPSRAPARSAKSTRAPSCSDSWATASAAAEGQAVAKAAVDASWLSGLQHEARELLGAGEPMVWETLTRRFEAQLILTALETTRGRRIEAAQKLGIGRNTITRKIQELGLDEK